MTSGHHKGILAAVVMLFPLPLAMASAERELPEEYEYFRDCDNCPIMIEVPAGSFLMGSPETEPDRRDGETQHKVTITAFAVGAFEVRYSEWNACFDSDCDGITLPEDQSSDDDMPLVYVTRNEAQLFVQWLSEHTGEDYRLLSEAEWEYVARAGTHTAYHYGSNLRVSDANCNRSVGLKGKTRRVGEYGHNEFGLFDVHGNVAEWVADCWHENYEGAPTDGSAWIAECMDENRFVVRGGGWNNELPQCRSASRLGFRDYDPVLNRIIRRPHVGFRVAKTCSIVDGLSQCQVSGVSEAVTSH